MYTCCRPAFQSKKQECKPPAWRSQGGKKVQSPTKHITVTAREERVAAIARLGNNAEITRFKGLGEISPEEFRGFIGPEMRLDLVTLRKEDAVGELLEFYMGKNTSERQNFIIDNLVVEDDSQIS